LRDFQANGASLQARISYGILGKVFPQRREIVGFRREKSMSVDQEREFRAENKNSKQTLLDTAPSQTSNDAQIPKSPGPTWRLLYRWLFTHTFAPQWLPDKWHHPIIGYIVAIFLQLIAVFITGLVLQLFPSISFAGLLEVLVVALVALNWGVGPSLIATLTGAALLNFVTLSPHYAWILTETDLVEVFLFLLVGVTISVVASQIEKARRNAEGLATSLTVERTRLEAIIETMPDALSIHDRQGKIVQINRAGRQNTGPGPVAYQANTDTIQTFGIRTVTGEHLPLEDLPVARALRGETVSSTELRFLNPTGQDIYALLSAAPLFDIEGKVEGAVLITHDITALHQSEREIALRASELEAVFESITDAVLLFSTEKQILRMNTATRELLVVNQQPDYPSLPANKRISLLEMHDEHGHLLTEEEWPMTRILHGEVLKGSNLSDVIIRTLEGREIALSVSGAPVRNHEGELIGALCICRDVTEQRQLEKRTQATLTTLLDMAEALVLVSDSTTGKSGEFAPVPTSKIAHRMADLTCRVLGCKRVSITAVELETEVLNPIAVVGLTPGQERQWWDEQRQGARLSDGPDSSLVAKLRANEVALLDLTQPPYSSQPNPFNIHTLLMAPMMVGNQLVGLLALDYGGLEHEYTTDEIALTKAVAKLAALVIERDRLLRERAESRANELALREANRRMDEFLGMTSHELKTPLTSIMGNTQLTVRQLRNSMLNFQKMQGMLESTERQIKFLDRLVNDLLDISRSQEQHLEVNLTPSNLASIVREAVEECRRTAPNRVITLAIPDELIAPVLADTDRIHQVMRNYLSNALKYSPAEKPLQVTLQVDEKNARVSVRDEGTGLSPHEQTQVWERFYRVHRAGTPGPSSSSDAGLGLGLYICKAIIEQHQGNVGVESTPGAGSTFWFTLPLAPITEPPTQ
jgi:PAS domain S-box-containing protein